jgi:chromosome segregation ATPase
MPTKRTDKGRKTLSARQGSATRKDLEDIKKEILHQFHMISEGLIDQIKLLAEGHSGIIQRLDRVDTRLGGVETRLDRVETRLDGVENRLDRVDTRLDGVETRLDRQDTRFDGVETKLDRMEKEHDEMKRENERQHEETRSLVKISFSELDRRISNLESQVKELQEWKNQVEARPRT